MVEISLSGSGEGPGWETSRPTLQSPFTLAGGGIPASPIGCHGALDAMRED